MCTSIAFSQYALYGRNLDLECGFGEQVAIAPRNQAFSFHHREPLREHYAMIGMASMAGNTPLFAEAANEKGLYIAGLNFPGNAHYFPEADARQLNLAPYELIPLLLGACATLAEARALLETVRLVAIPFAPGYPLSPLHWHIADSTGSLVVESMADGLHIYENPVGVMTNNPPFPYHLMRLNDYQALSPRQPENRFAPALDLRCYGQGMGAIGLPGDASPMSRFVRAAFLKSHAVFEEDAQARVEQFFHILRAVGMVRGSVMTPEGKFDETTYSCCIDAANGMYYYTTYFNSRVTAVSLFDEPLNGSTARAFPLERAPQFHYVNRA